MSLSSHTEYSKITLKRKIEEFLAQGRTTFYFREMVEEAHVSVRDAEDFLLPLLEENKIEGKLELRCPNCEADIGTFRKYKEIPQEIECEICGHKFLRADEYLNIVLEVAGTKFFRTHSISSTSHQKETHQARNEEIAERRC